MLETRRKPPLNRHTAGKTLPGTYAFPPGQIFEHNLTKMS